MNKFTADYFIKKFEAIPRGEWTKFQYENDKGQKCALGHCGQKPYMCTDESNALETLFFNRLGTHVDTVNDESYAYRTTPKGRILAALREIKKRSKE